MRKAFHFFNGADRMLGKYASNVAKGNQYSDRVQ